MKRVRRILFATDFSTASRRAFDTALALAKATDAKPTILSVIPPVLAAVPEVYLDAATIERLEQQSRQWATRELQKLTTRAKRAGVRVTILLRTGDPVREVLRTATAQRADLLVVGTHGRRGLSKFVLGSVAERLIAQAPCPVVAVRGPSKFRWTTT
jgi:nucleotide-binding universal stress UspA family protein